MYFHMQEKEKGGGGTSTNYRYVFGHLGTTRVAPGEKEHDGE